MARIREEDQELITILTVTTTINQCPDQITLNWIKIAHRVQIATWLLVNRLARHLKCISNLFTNSWAAVLRARFLSKDWRAPLWIKGFREASQESIRMMMGTIASMMKLIISIIMEAIQAIWAPRGCHRLEDRKWERSEFLFKLITIENLIYKSIPAICDIEKDCKKFTTC